MGRVGGTGGSKCGMKQAWSILNRALTWQPAMQRAPWALLALHHRFPPGMHVPWSATHRAGLAPPSMLPPSTAELMAALMPARSMASRAASVLGLTCQAGRRAWGAAGCRVCSVAGTPPGCHCSGAWRAAASRGSVLLAARPPHHPGRQPRPPASQAHLVAAGLLAQRAQLHQRADRIVHTLVGGRWVGWGCMGAARCEGVPGCEHGQEGRREAAPSLAGGRAGAVAPSR